MERVIWKLIKVGSIVVAFLTYAFAISVIANWEVCYEFLESATLYAYVALASLAVLLALILVIRVE